ncbi:hypothetical protein [Gabonia massiliensis]|uniref:hypothetical protein n=1 Tax=Gabonia massiliensis TaxID=1686296 RepID=UPI00093937C7|nr:hypothetical protein [Gabonia massiliensis]
MKKLLFISLLLFPLLSAGVKESSSTVYICNGPKSYAYHKTDKCKGLRRCSTEIEAVSLKEALDMGRKACKICY